MNDAKIELEWSYSPADYFEEKIVWKREDYSIEIAGGHILAKMNADFFDSKTDLHNSLTQELNNYFRGSLPIRRRAFYIHIGGFNRIWPDGRRDTTLEVQPAKFTLTFRSVDLIHKDTDGKIIGNTRRDRIDATKKLAELSSRYVPVDPTVSRIFDSFDAAVRYPGSSLVYLYEVWEALQTKFRKGKRAQKILGIENTGRSRLTKLANDEPLNQGRHRGRFAGKLRNVATNELDEAWAIARSMYEKYLDYLKKHDMFRA